MNNDLEAFGRAVIEEVRDSAIEHWTQILDGRMRGATAQETLSALVAAKTPVEGAKAILPDVVNTVLHRFMQLLEDEQISIRWNGTDVAEESDGLAGELATQKGWIARFSRTSQGQMAK